MSISNYSPEELYVVFQAVSFMPTHPPATPTYSIVIAIEVKVNRSRNENEYFNFQPSKLIFWVKSGYLKQHLNLISSCLLLMQHQVITLTDDSTSRTCLSVFKHISPLMARGENFDNADRLLCSIGKLDGICALQTTTCCSTMRQIQIR